MKGAPTRSYMNSSKRDYSETRELNCRACKEPFQSVQIFFSGKPIAPAPELCPECEQISSCAPFLLPRTRVTPAASKTRESWASALSEHFLQELQNLCYAAKCGDDRALTFLVEISKISTFVLHQVAMDEPERLRPLASRDIAWPAFIGPKSGSARINRHLIEALQIGTNCPYAGRWKPDSPATVTALCMTHWLEANQQRLELAPLSRTTQRAWFDIGWRALLIATNGCPEGHDYLKQIGQSASRKKPERRGMHTLTPAMQRDDIRAKIKENVWKSFRSVTGNFPQT
jgi:hypothetical protein